MKVTLKQPVCVLSSRRDSSGPSRPRSSAVAKAGATDPKALSFRRMHAQGGLSAVSLPRSTSRKACITYASAANMKPPSTKPEGVAPSLSASASLKLALVNLYLNVFGGFEGGIKFLVDTMFPEKVQSIFSGLFASYKQQVTISMKGDEAAASSKTAVIFRELIRAIAGQMIGVPYKFPSYHTAIREGPIDYFKLGNDYVGTLINYERSLMGNDHLWVKIDQQLEAKENVVLFANHQSEADAAFIPLLTQGAHPGLGEKVVYIAGDRVVTDLMSKPFSMGRNLLCINSKKHMVSDDSATKSIKMRQNIATLKAMEKLMQEGGHCIWIAPSGGRDRRQADGTLAPDQFDPSSIELMKKFASKAKSKPTHFYPLAMATYDTMPPPTSIGGDLGEVRVVTYCGCGLSLADEVDVSNSGQWAKGLQEGDDTAKVLASHIYDKVCTEYAKIGPCMANDTPSVIPDGCVRPTQSWK